jgi:hypothetical protein
MCQAMQKEGAMQLARQADSWEVVGCSDRLLRLARPPRRSPPPAKAPPAAGERWVMS